MSYYAVKSKKAIEKLQEIKDYFDPAKAVKGINPTKATDKLDYVIEFLNEIIEDEYVNAED